MRQLYIVLISIFIFSGCAVVNEYTDSYKLKYIHWTTTTNFQSLTKTLLEEICDQDDTLKQKLLQKPIYVVDFVNLKDLENHSELGFMLSDELKTHATQMCNMKIYSLEYTKYLKIGANGTKLLSRDVEDLNQTKVNKNTYALVGTYALTQRQLILYLKLIDLKTGVILHSATNDTTLTDEIIHFELQAKEKRVNPNLIRKPLTL